MFKNYLKITIRNIWKNKLYSVINILGLSIAITGCLLIIFFVEDELTFDDFHSKKENIYRLNGIFIRPSTGEKIEFGSSSPIMATEFKNQVPGISEVVRLDGNSVLVLKDNEPVRENILFADPWLFSVFDFPVISGDWKTLKTDINSIIITETYAKKYFETPPVGKTLPVELGGEYLDLTVAAVVEDIPDNSSIKFDIVVPFEKYRQLAEERRFTSWLDLHISTMVLLEDAVDVSLIEKNLNKVLYSKISEEDRESFSLKLQPFTKLHFGSVSGGNGIAQPGSIQSSMILSSVGIFLLVIASINFTNLSMGMAIPRAREIGLRKVIGADRFQLIKQFLGESFALSLISMLLGVLMVDLFLPAFEQLTNKSFAIESIYHWKIIMAAIVLLITTTLLSGLYPAFVISGFKPVISLKGKQKLGDRSWVSRSLIVLQFIISIVFLIGTLVMQKQFNFIRTFDKGYNDKGLISINMPLENNALLWERFEETFNKHVFVKGITGATGSGWTTSFEYNGNTYETNHDKIDTDYFETLEVEMVTGRSFDPERATDKSDAIIVNQAFIDMIGMTDPVGERVGFNYFESMTAPKIIGVVSDFNYQPLVTEIKPMVYYIHSDRPLREMLVKIDETHTSEAIQLITDTWKDFIPMIPLTYDFVEDMNMQFYEKEQKQREVIQYASVFAILISCLGLFGLASLHIKQRTQEVGIRKVLGASLNEIFMVLSKNFALLVLAAFILASPVAWYLSDQWLANFAYRTKISWWIFAASGTLVFIIAMISIAYQSIRTTLINPVDTLKEE